MLQLVFFLSLSLAGYEADSIQIKSDSDWASVSTQIKDGLTEIRGDLVISGTKSLKGSDLGYAFAPAADACGAGCRVPGVRWVGWHAHTFAKALAFNDQRQCICDAHCAGRVYKRGTGVVAHCCGRR